MHSEIETRLAVIDRTVRKLTRDWWGVKYETAVQRDPIYNGAPGPRGQTVIGGMQPWTFSVRVSWNVYNKGRICRAEDQHFWSEAEIAMAPSAQALIEETARWIDRIAKGPSGWD